MTIPEEARRVRAVLSTPGKPDIRFELVRMSATDFSVLEDGKSVGVYYQALSRLPVGGPTSSREGAHLSISKAFEGCLAKRYQGYTANQVEYATE